MKKRYKTDLSDEQWKLISRYLPQRQGPGRKPKYDMREIINAILYVVHTGCRWAMIPHDFPPWYSVYYRFNKWRKNQTWFLIHQVLHRQLREHAGKEPEPTAAIIDSQSIKTSKFAETRGFDGNKKINGRKRHVAADTLGFPLAVKVHDANLPDGKQAFNVLESLFFWFSSIQKIRADAAYRGDLALWLLAAHQCRLEIASTLKGQGFQVVPKRWIIERTFGWLQWSRRLRTDYEVYPDTAETMVYLASLKILLRRLA